MKFSLASLLVAPLELSLVLAAAIPAPQIGEIGTAVHLTGSLDLIVMNAITKQRMGWLGADPRSADRYALTVDPESAHKDFTIDTTGRFTYYHSGETFVASFEPNPTTNRAASDSVAPVNFISTITHAADLKKITENEKFGLKLNGMVDLEKRKVLGLGMNDNYDWWACKIGGKLVVSAPTQLSDSFVQWFGDCTKIHIYADL